MRPFAAFVVGVNVAWAIEAALDSRVWVIYVALALVVAGTNLVRRRDDD